jgi:hypothetical protein
MSYIGRQPVVGNFVKLDAITTSATATYNLTNGGVAYFPQTANNCIVSLNGVIQSPTSAYTISGSTIVFSDALTSSDTIDFILVLGDVLSIGTPSDGTITSAKLASGVSGLISWQSVVTASTLTAVSGRGYFIDTTSNACTITLPASATVGDTIILVDYARNWGTNAVTLNPNSLKFQGGTSNAIYNTSGQSVTIVYSGTTKGWIPTVDDDVSDEQTSTVDFKIWGAGGGGSAGGVDGEGGGSGGFVAGTYILNKGLTVVAVVGGGGTGGVSGRGGGGAGYSGVFNTSVSQGNALLIAAGGSGGARSTHVGKGGGGLTGTAGDGTGGGGAGTQSAGGAAGAGGSSNAGSALQGGSATAGSGGTAFGGGGDGGGDNASYTAGGGSGGYYGGGSGGVSSGSGGSGSSYVGTATSTTNTSGNNGSSSTGGAAVNTGDAQYPGSNIGKGGNGNTSGGAGTAGNNGAVVYRKDGGSWITLSYTGSNQTFTI